MRVTRKYRIQLFLMTIFACLSFSFVFAATETDVINALYNTAQSDPIQVHTLISKYCSSVLESPRFVKNDVPYDAKQSVFVYLLCSNISSASKSYFSDKNYFVRTSFKDLDFTDYIDENYDLCAPKTMDNECDLATNIPKLFNAIMNDYMNVEQYRIYSFIDAYGSDAELSSVVNKYSQAYFGINICENSQHPYHKTCRMVKSYVKNARNILSEIRIFDPKILEKIVLEDDPLCSTTDADIFYCGLKDGELTMSSFINLVYNEMFYYRLFMGYYLTMLQKYPSLVSNYSSVYKRFTTQYGWSKSALSLSLRMIRDMYMAFPFHVGFSMYQEDLDGLGKIVARIVMPIYTLYDKLRNVQEPQ